MAPPCACSPRSDHSTPLRRRRSNPISGRLNAAGAERGQALIITTIAMTLVLLMSAFAIDLATWYQKHHQAQVAADAAALAAANCLANGKTVSTPNGISCSSYTDTTAAQQVGTNIATTNLPNSNDQVTVNTTNKTVTVTATSQPQVDFAGIVAMHPTVTARSVASYNLPLANYSVFVGNPTCTVNSSGVGGLQIQSNGGGNAAVTGLYSDGTIQNNDNSNIANYSGGISDGQTTGGYQATATPLCGDGSGSTGTGGSDNYWQTKNTNVSAGEETAYPEQYNEPTLGGSTYINTYPNTTPTPTPGTCTFASTYFSTSVTSGPHQMRFPGIYCVIDSSGNIATSYSGSCSAPSGNTSSVDQSTGSIFVSSTLQGAYEFVGPCVVGVASGTKNPGITNSIQAINAQTPLIYGTAQQGSPPATPCLDPTTTFVNPSAITYQPDNVYLYGNNLTLNAPIYAPCGTVELSQNNDFNAFIEAANVTIDKNNFSAWNGTGPAAAPAQDGLSG